MGISHIISFIDNVTKFMKSNLHFNNINELAHRAFDLQFFTSCNTGLYLAPAEAQHLL